MNNFKLKIIVTMLGGIVFSFIFIVLAFVLPTKKHIQYEKQPTNKLGEVAKSFRDR